MQSHSNPTPPPPSPPYLLEVNAVCLDGFLHMVNTYLHFLTLIFLFFLDSVSNLCLKDLSTIVIAELVCSLLADPNALQRFYQSFGLDREKLRPYMLHDIAEFIPDTPVKLLKDVFQEFQFPSFSSPERNEEKRQ